MNNISPIDGRYRHYTKELNDIFSEKAYILQKLIIEIYYFVFLLKLDSQSFPYKAELENLMLDFIKLLTDEDINEIKKIENTINHDVKSIEYFLAKFLKKNNYSQYINLLHFGLTSQDINTMTYSDSLYKFNTLVKNNIDNLFIEMNKSISKWNEVVIVGRTHGQAASWTILGKEFKVFLSKLQLESTNLDNYKFTTKFGGAVGNMTSHKLLDNKINWDNELDNFVKKFNLKRSKITTQIHNYNEYAQYFDILKRICSILIDMCVDIWLYCSFGELTLIKPNEHVGSSIMPHKVNPIEFENAEGNLKIAEMWLQFFSQELCKSRLQRDLTDSTILRNLGVMGGHFLIAIKNIIKGFTYLQENREKIEKILYENLNSMSEIDQHLLRIENKVNGYDEVKKNPTKNKPIQSKDKNLELIETYKKYILI